MERARRTSILVVALSVFALTACSGGGGEVENPLPSPAATEAEAPTTAPDTAAPSASDTTGGTASPGTTSTDTASPATTGATPSATVLPATCTSVTPVRVARVDTGPRRTTEVVSVVSDGRNLTSGTREQSDFLTPVLTSPDQTVVTDDATIRKIAALIAAEKHRVLLVRPDAPDANLNVSKKPFSAPGTYVIYNASSQLTADVVVQCSGQEQTWTLLAEADPSVGQVNCTVEPSRSNALARLIYQNNC
jgi:hypothetical protein